MKSRHIEHNDVVHPSGNFCVMIAHHCETWCHEPVHPRRVLVSISSKEIFRQNVPRLIPWCHAVYFLKIKFIFKKKKEDVNFPFGWRHGHFCDICRRHQLPTWRNASAGTIPSLSTCFFCFRVDGPLINAIMGASEFTSDIFFFLRGFRPIRTIPELITVLALWRLICERRWNETDTDR